MCGIAGFSGSGHQIDCERMLEKILHRGPDEGNSVSFDPIPGWFGMRRLDILDSDGGHQPMWTEDGKYGLVFNGEIYNHQDLRAELGGPFQSSHSDTETLLQGFAKWGPDVFAKLNGMFATAILDKGQRSLTFARDRFGKKPLYYWTHGTQIVFSSELKSLLASGLLPFEIDHHALQLYFAYGYVPAPFSMVKGVRKLEAGHWMSFDLDSGEMKDHVFWDPTFVASTNVSGSLEEGESLLAQAIQRRFQSDHEVGVFLSGGIDSSLVSAMAAKQQNIRSFSIGFREKSFDERQYSELVATHIGSKHHVSIFDMTSAHGMMDQILGQIDEPLADASLLPTYAVSQLAAQHLKVILGGDGADELLMGYDPFRAIFPAKLFHRLTPNWAAKGLHNLVQKLPVSHRNMSLDFKLKRTLGGLLHEPEFWLATWMAPTGPSLLTQLFGSIDIRDLFAYSAQVWRETPGDFYQKTRGYYLKTYLQNDILTKVDRASMLHSLEVRAPFLDNDFANWALSLPRKDWYSMGVSKKLLRQIAKKYLPEAIIVRSKKGFGVPIGQWFKDGKIQLPKQSNLPLDWKVVLRAQEEHRAGKHDHRTMLWCAYTADIWLNGMRHLDR